MPSMTQINPPLYMVTPLGEAVAQLAETALKNRDQSEGEAAILAAIKMAIAKATHSVS